MDYPHGHHPHHHHHHHHTHHGRREEEEYPPPARPPPPPYFGMNEPPPPNVFHTSHSGPGPRPGFYPGPPPPGMPNYSDYGEPYPPPPPAMPHFPEYGEPYRPPPPPAVDHRPHHPHMPHFPSNVIDHIHHKDEFANKPSVRMYCKAETNYSLTIRDGKVILARSDPSDPFQHWIRDEKFSTKVKDEEGYPSFALINKATGQAMKHSIGATHPVQLIPYDPNHLDESILWTASKDLGDGYRAIRMVNNIRLNVDAFNGDKNHGGVHDGTKVVLWEWKKGENQRWKIVPYWCVAALSANAC